MYTQEGESSLTVNGIGKIQTPPETVCVHVILHSFSPALSKVVKLFSHARLSELLQGLTFQRIKKKNQTHTANKKQLLENHFFSLNESF